MRQLSLIIIFSATFQLIACNKQVAPEFTYNDGIDRNNEETKQVIRSFLASCPVVAEESKNFDQLLVSRGTSITHTPDYGWHNGFNIKFHVTKDPTGDKKWLQAADFNCWADIGGGLKPGVDIYKPTCATLCSGKQTERLFYPDNQLTIIESKSDSTSAENNRINSNPDKNNKLMRNAFAGNYQAQRNIAYGYATGTFGSEYDPIKGCAWYMIIILSKHKEVNPSDASNYKLHCERLQKDDHETALNYAEAIKTKIENLNK